MLAVKKSVAVMIYLARRMQHIQPSNIMILLLFQTPLGITVIMVPFDRSYYNDLTAKIQMNYENVFVPEYFEQR